MYEVPKTTEEARATIEIKAAKRLKIASGPYWTRLLSTIESFESLECLFLQVVGPSKCQRGQIHWRRVGRPESQDRKGNQGFQRYEKKEKYEGVRDAKTSYQRQHCTEGVVVRRNAKGAGSIKTAERFESSRTPDSIKRAKKERKGIQEFKVGKGGKR